MATLFRLIDKDGNRDNGAYYSAREAAEAAKRIWPDQEQDENRSGKGWDIEPVPTTD